MTPDDAIRVALAEAERPAWAAGRQFFAVHRLAENNPVAHVERDAGKAWVVSLRVRDCPFFWNVSVAEGQRGPEVVGCGETDGGFVYFAIGHDDVPAARMTELIGRPSTDAWVKGELIRPGLRVRAKYHRWELQPDVPEPWSMERKVAALLAELQPLSERIGVLDAGFVRRAVLVPYPSGYYNWGLTLDENVIASLARLKAKLELDAYFEGPEWPLDDAP